MGIPVLGICYGMQLEAHHLGGRVARSEKPEFGDTKMTVTESHPLISCAGEDISMSHDDRVYLLPEGFRSVAETEITPYAAMVNDERKIYGVQFHPERIESGIPIIEWFVGLCKERT